MLWQLYRAKQFNAFKRYIQEELKPLVIKQLTSELIATRNDQFPNSDIHIEASCYYWGLYNIRILQWALNKEIITEEWLKKSGKYRHCQHLFHVEQSYFHESVIKIGEE